MSSVKKVNKCPYCKHENVYYAKFQVKQEVHKCLNCKRNYFVKYRLYGGDIIHKLGKHFQIGEVEVVSNKREVKTSLF